MAMGKARIAAGKKRGGKARAWRYSIGIGSNQPLARGLGPRALVEAAFAALDRKPFRLIARSPVITSRPLGPSRRSYANAVALIATDKEPPAVLARLQKLERAAGRRRARRWGARTLDLDIVLWDGGLFAAPGLAIPHPAFRTRGFVLGPLRAVAPRWRDPVSGLSITQLSARLAKAKPVDPTTAPR
jgi:2-amino-4-hydroxy-6-hydroxymethyldihydropteridine diphosphokinase